MSADESSVTTEPVPENNEVEQQNVISRVADLPLVSSTYNMVSSTYSSTKETHPILKSVCDVAEKGVKMLTDAAICGAQPLLTKLEPQITTANEYACMGLDKLEEKLPILRQPSEKVVEDTKEMVSTRITGARNAVSLTVASSVNGVMGLAKGGVEMTRLAVASSVDTVKGSRVGQLVAAGMEAVLGKSESLVEHYLPMTDQELAQLATSVEGFEVATVEQQKEQRSYFVRLGSLSAKIRHRAFRHSVAKLNDTKQATQEALTQLHQAIELVEHMKQGVDQKIQSSQEKLHQMYLEWNQKQTGTGEETESLAEPEVESRTLAMFRGLTHQLQLSTATLLSRVQGLPAGIQTNIQSVTNTVEDLRTSFSLARSFHDLPATLLAQSREQIAKARGAVDEMFDYVVHNVPLPWVVGPFSPDLVELPAAPGLVELPEATAHASEKVGSDRENLDAESDRSECDSLAPEKSP